MVLHGILQRRSAQVAPGGVDRQGVASQNDSRPFVRKRSLRVTNEHVSVHAPARLLEIRPMFVSEKRAYHAAPRAQALCTNGEMVGS